LIDIIKLLRNAWCHSGIHLAAFTGALSALTVAQRRLGKYLHIRQLQIIGGRVAGMVPSVSRRTVRSALAPESSLCACHAFAADKLTRDQDHVPPVI
jgi:hypothetical protein